MKNSDNFNGILDLDLGVPEWAIENPYLKLLSSRFFESQENINWEDLSKRVGRMFYWVEREYETEDVALKNTERLVRLIND